ncbi:MAG: transposase [Marinobacter sp.]|nr:transposase [Marinobacter sp.]
MTRKRRFFSPEFKHDAASLVLDQGYSFSEACQATDVGKTALRRWVQQLADDREGIVAPKDKALTPEQRRILELETRCKRLEMEKDILRKAAALLMSDDMNRVR